MYLFFDGDNVGPEIERLLTSGEVSEASKLSEAINIAISGLREWLNSQSEVELLLCGGGDILIRFDSEKNRRDVIDHVRSQFRLITGLTISCGVGIAPKDAIWNLHLAKLYGRDRVVGLQGK